MKITEVNINKYCLCIQSLIYVAFSLYAHKCYAVLHMSLHYDAGLFSQSQTALFP